MPDFNMLSILHNTLQWFKRILTGIDRKLIIPLSQWIALRLSRRSRAKIRAYHMLPDGVSDWKDKALENFGIWLDALPETPSAGEAATMDSCDLYTLLTEFSALRQEIRMQSREQAKSIKTLSAFTDVYREASDAFENATALFQKRTRGLADLERNIRRDSEKKAVKAFLDVRDALMRGLHAAQTVPKKQSFLRPAPREISGIAEGYEMALRRFDRALTAVNVYPIETLNQTFDPVTMKAVSTRTIAGVEKGMVVEEQLGGFVMEDEVLRTAEVVVSG